jgi:hypothetical protein
MSKWACTSHFSTWNTSYSRKKGRESKCQFDSQPLKVNNCPNLLPWGWRATYIWKDLDEFYNFSFDFTSIGALHKKLWASKVARVPILRISRLLIWESQVNMTFGCSPVVNHILHIVKDVVNFSIHPLIHPVIHPQAVTHRSISV